LGDPDVLDHTARTRRWSVSAAALLLALGCGESASSAGRNLLLITLDTTRADGLSLLGGPQGATPNLDALGAQSVVFEVAYSETNVTNPSHLSIMTGMASRRHGVTSNFSRLPDGPDSLAESLGRAGYATAGFVSARPLGPAFGWKGFDVLPEIAGELDAAEVTDRALAWLGEPRERPFFLWVHYWNPHTMYEPPDELFERFYHGDPTAGDGPPIAAAPFFDRATGFGIGARLKRWLGSVRDPAWARAKYIAELHYTDRELGRLLGGLERSGRIDDTVIVVTADHGESLGEHGIYYAHVGVYDEVLRIPLLVRVPGLPARRLALPVWTLDIAPTAAELLGVELRSAVDGLSLVSALRGEPAAALRQRRRFVHPHASNRAVAIREGSWKLIWPVERNDRVLGGAVELFDLSTDPGEQRNLAAAHPEVVDRLRAAIEPWVAPGPSRPPTSSQLDPGIRQQLEALGYSE
jgi:arylsulfatase A-like enzyme